MILRLLLVLLLVLPAGLTAGQHQRCALTDAAATIDSDAGAHHGSSESHHASHGDSAATAGPTSACEGCDLACKVTCAAVALPLGIQPSASPPSGTAAPGTLVAGLLNPHPLPLLRPPAYTPA